MKKRLFQVMAVAALCLIALVVKADVFDDIAGALRSGNARSVARYFDSTVELKTADKSSSYSKNQAELVLKEFLDNYGVRGFNVVHKGSSAQGAQYAIGSLDTGKGSFRTYIYMKDVGGKMYIQELTFEKQ